MNPDTRRRSKPRRRTAGRLAAALVLAGVAAGPARAEIVIGVAGPLSGDFAVLGEEMRAGAALAVDHINRRGGIGGEPLRLEAMDDRCEASTGDAVANQLAGKGAVAVVGHLCLGPSIAASSVYASNRIVQISPGTTFPKFTDERPGPGIFRLSGRDDDQGRVAGAFLAAHFADRAVAIVDDRSDYGRALADGARAAMNAAGKREVLTASLDPDNPDYAELVSRLKAAGIDALFFGGYHGVAGTVVRLMREQGATATFVSGDALATEEYWRLAGEAGQGTLMTFPPDWRETPAASEAVAAFRAAGTEPEGYVLPSYAAVELWAAAAIAAGATDMDAVAAALAERAFPTVLGEVSFDPKGDARLAGFAVYEWRDGRFAMLAE